MAPSLSKSSAASSTARVKGWPTLSSNAALISGLSRVTNCDLRTPPPKYWVMPPPADVFVSDMGWVGKEGGVGGREGVRACGRADRRGRARRGAVARRA